MKYLLIGLSLLFISFIFSGCSTVTDSTPVSAENLATSAQTSQVSDRAYISEEEIKFAPSNESKGILRIKDSFKVYNSSKGRASGVYEYQDLVFVIVNVDYGKEKTAQRLAKGTAMLRAKHLLKTTYKLSSNYRLRTHQLEAREFFHKKIYRYAFVCLKKDINVIKTSEVKSTCPTISPTMPGSQSVPKASLRKETAAQTIKIEPSSQKKTDVIVFSGDKNISDDF